jgi:protein-disulfide isomerase
MFRWLQLMIFRRAYIALLLICVGCSAQSRPASPASASAASLPPDVMKSVERQVRAYYSLPPSVNVVAQPLQPSEFPNYDALTLIFDSPEKKRNYDFLLSKDRKNLIRITKMDLTKDPYAEIMKKIDVAGRPSRGNKQAKVVVVNYDDFECPFCSRMHATIFSEIFKDYSDRVLFVYKDYPLEEIHPWAVHAAINANCLGAQSGDAYWDYADYLHGNAGSVNGMKGRDGQDAELDRLATIQGQRHNLDTNKLAACIKQQDEKGVRASMDEAEGVGVNATPTMFVNGEKLDGAVPASDIRAALDRALQDAGVQTGHPANSTATNGASPTSK